MNTSYQQAHEELIKALKTMGQIRHFLPKRQGLFLLKSLYSSDLKRSEWARNAVHSINNTVSTMPKTYETDGQGDNAIVHLHYFAGNSEFFIIEKDCTPQQLQAFGFADCGSPELGYIAISEIIAIQSAVLDLHWQPKSLADVKADVRAKYALLGG